MGDTVVVTDDDGGGTSDDIATETVIEHAEDIGTLKAEQAHLAERMDGVETAVGGLAIAVEGLDDRITEAVRVAFDASMAAMTANEKADEIVDEITEAVEDAADEISEEDDEKPPPPPDEPPNSKQHPWWK